MSATDILETPIALYSFEYRFIPSLINNLLNKTKNQLDFFISGFADKVLGFWKLQLKHSPQLTEAYV